MNLSQIALLHHWSCQFPSSSSSVLQGSIGRVSSDGAPRRSATPPPELSSPSLDISRLSLVLKRFSHDSIASCRVHPAPAEKGQGSVGIEVAACRTQGEPDNAACLPTWVLTWCQRFGIAHEHLTERHDNVSLLLLFLSSPTWFTLPYILMLWGHYGQWRMLYWVPGVAFGLALQGLCACALWHPPDEYFLTKQGLAITGFATCAYSVIMCGPLALMPTCGGSCVPLGNVLAFTGAVLAFTLMQVRAYP